MIDGLKPYPKYKDSGVPWLGEVPEHWEVARNGRLFAERREVGFPELPVLEVSLRTGVRVRNGDSGARKQALGDVSAYKRARAGDIAYNMMRMWQGAVGVAPVDGLVSPAYVVARPFPEADSRYYESLFRTPAYMGEVNNYSRGIVPDRNRLYWDEFKDVRSPVPPHEEQVLIVRFLRAMDRRIARYIRAKKKLIALLNEQKQAIIHRAVTRGLDPNVPLKPSGIDWLGNVPVHWEVRSLVRIALERADYRGSTPTKTETGVFLVTARNIKKGWIDYDASREYVSETEYSKIMRRGLPRRGDLLLTTEAPLGHAALVDREDIALAQRVIRFRFDSRSIGPQFAIHVVLSPYFQHQLLRRSTGSTAVGIKASKLSQIQVVLPPLNEQRQILDYLTCALTPLEEIVNRATTEIALLGEFRQRLLADVVTGKLDVREAAASLPLVGEADEFPEIGDTEEQAGDESDAEMEAVEIEE